MRTSGGRFNYNFTISRAGQYRLQVERVDYKSYVSLLFFVDPVITENQRPTLRRIDISLADHDWGKPSDGFIGPPQR